MTAIRTEIVLLGGGHAHVAVLAAFGRKPEPGVRLTLVARDIEAAYSGMVPGVIAGHYPPEACHIDLVRLCAATGTRLIHATASGLDHLARTVSLDGRAVPIAYDLLSIDVGATPSTAGIAGAERHALALKPISTLLPRIEALVADCLTPKGPRRIAMIGGGASGVEVTLALRARLRREAAAHGLDPDAFTFTLVSATEILPTVSLAARRRVLRALAAAGVAILAGVRVASVEAGRLTLADGRRVEADAALLAAQAAPAPWLARCGLSTDDAGFLAVDRHLQIVNDQHVFAAGDCATMVETPRPKSGVFAVRQGPVLAENLRRRARGEALRAYRPQHQALALISTGERHAVATRGAFATEGRWVWRLKDRIDRGFVRRYDVSAPIGPARPPRRGPDGGIAPAMIAALRDELGLSAATGPVPLSLRPTAVDDPHVAGELAAAQALAPSLAAGVGPAAAHAVIVVRPDAPHVMQDTLRQVFAGLRARLAAEGVELAHLGGVVGADTMIGLSLASAAAAPPRAVALVDEGAHLILTRPIGGGVLLAATDTVGVRGRDLATMLALARCPYGPELAALRACGAAAIVAQGGGGLAGAAADLAAIVGRSVRLDVATIPVLAGAAACCPALQSQMAPGAASVRLVDQAETAGGFLAIVSKEQSEACLAALRAIGATHAARVGVIGEPAAAGAAQVSFTA